MKEKFKNIDYKVMIFFCFIMSIAFYFIKKNNPELDSFYMAATGRYIVEHKSLPKTNVFLFDNQVSLTVQQWLFCVLCYVVYENIGIVGAFLYSYGIFFLDIFVLFRLLQKVNHKTNENLFTVAFFSILLSKFVNFRPQTLDLLFLLFLLNTLFDYRVTRNEKKLYIIPPILSFLTVNIHASYWIFYFVFMLPFLFIEHTKWNLKAYIKRTYPIFISMILMIIAGFLNPNGYKSMLYFRYLFVDEIKIIVGELQPTYKSPFFFYVLCSIIFLYLYIRKIGIDQIIKEMKNNTESIHIPLIYLSLGTIILAMICYKNLWFLLVSSPFLFSEIFTYKTKDDVFTKIYYKVLIIVTVIILYLTYISSSRYRDNGAFPLKAMEYIKENNIETNAIYSEYDMGSYLEWLGYSAYVDTRAEMLFKKANNKKDLFQEYIDLQSGILDIPEFMNRYQFEYVICYKNTPLDTYLMENNYHQILEGNSYHFFKIK